MGGTGVWEEWGRGGSTWGVCNTPGSWERGLYIKGGRDVMIYSFQKVRAKRSRAETFTYIRLYNYTEMIVCNFTGNFLLYFSWSAFLVIVGVKSFLRIDSKNFLAAKPLHCKWFFFLLVIHIFCWFCFHTFWEFDFLCCPFISFWFDLSSQVLHRRMSPVGFFLFFIFLRFWFGLFFN